MSDSISRCVPFCRRTRTNEAQAYAGWNCGGHWKLADKKRRRVWGRIRARWQRFEPPPNACVIADRLWAALKRQVIERAAGISG